MVPNLPTDEPQETPQAEPYEPCDCGADCDLHEDKPDEPCWGCVQAEDEFDLGDGDYQWAHACRGHREYSTGGKYIHEGED